MMSTRIIDHLLTIPKIAMEKCQWKWHFLAIINLSGRALKIPKKYKLSVLLKDISHTLVNVGDVMYTKILVPIDGSAHSQHALSVACKLFYQRT